ncbi:MAG: type VI secretion system baseplate subunit TssE [Bryobacteraceae bacterium]|nr:type VI secretion system baseplate subunit TssE [Bryobacteraceae bacterium]MDW8377370.1 type VI secretion system baseplate subunit TssE [Bryobacterales bacterium]
MPRENEQLVTLPLIDRLTDLDPKTRSEPGMTRAQSIRLLKAALRRDLEWLFNTRANHDIPPPNEMPEVFRSVINYGLPDFTNLSFSTVRDRNKLLRQLELAITMFEPRLTGVQVRLLESDLEITKSLRFQIDAFLKMDPAPEHITFDTVLDIPSGEYEVKGDASAG